MRTSTIIGTPQYMSPEVILGKEYSFQIDFWDITICTYEEFFCDQFLLEKILKILY